MLATMIESEKNKETNKETKVQPMEPANNKDNFNPHD